MDIQYLRTNGLIVLECVSGSKSYGLELPHSDTDIKGVFILPKVKFYGLDYVAQISNESNDIIFYELKRFMELLYKNNPNILELFGLTNENIIYKHPLLDAVKPELFLSKRCRETFASYAFSQIKKAKGLNKKINNPVDKERKNILHFCYVTAASKTIPLLNWLEEKQLRQEQCGLAALNHMRDMYALFADIGKNLGYKGMMSKETSNDVTLSSIPKSEVPLAYMYFNKDGYSVYCKDYKSFWEWTGKRNEARYQNTLQHGKQYDAKNMMHVFRLLDMAEEIALGKGVITERPNRDFLLRIRNGEFEYDALLQEAGKKIERIESLFETSSLPDEPDKDTVEKLLVDLRVQYYNE